MCRSSNLSYIQWASHGSNLGDPHRSEASPAAVLVCTRDEWGIRKPFGRLCSFCFCCENWNPLFASCAAILRIGKKLGSYQVACADYTSRWMCYSPRNTFVRQSPHNIYSIFRMCLAQTPSGTSASYHWKCIHSRHWMTQRNMTKITSSISSVP